MNWKNIKSPEAGASSARLWNIKSKVSYILLLNISKIIDYTNICIIKYKIIKHYLNKYFIKNKLASVECINLSNNSIKLLTYRPAYIFRNIFNIYNYKISKVEINHNTIFMINFCNYKGKIISYLITGKQFKILTKNKGFINHGKLINLINNLNTHTHINILHSAINDIEITTYTKHYIKSLNNITVDNFIKFLKIKYLLYIDTKNSDLVVMDSDFLDEYIFNSNDLITLNQATLSRENEISNF
jgi:hypothetical protein